MREFLYDKNFITTKLLLPAKLLLILALILFFTPLVILPFFDHASADDYICGYHLSNKGFWEYQSFIYNNWGGRFAATFVGSLFARNNFLYDHYYFHSLLLLFLNAISVFLLLAVLNKHVLKDEKIKKHFVWIALLFLALQYVSLVEPSTYIFWFSSAVTYQTPIILFELQVVCWIIFFHTSSAKKFLYFLALFFLIVLINGFNELFIVAQASVFLLLFLSKAIKKIPKIYIVFLVAGFIASAAIVLLSPGILTRASVIEGKGFFVGISATGFHVAQALWSVLKNPLAWFALVVVFVFANNNRKKFYQLFLIQYFRSKRWVLPLLMIFFLVASIAVAVLGLKGGIIPDRYVNAIAVITLCFLLFLSFVEGVFLNRDFFDLSLVQMQLTLFVVCTITLVANDYIKEGYKSLIIAPLYDNIMNEREVALKEAADTHKIAELKLYDTALKEHLKTDYNKSPKTLYDLVQQKPTFIFFNDDLATKYSTETLQAFYKVDSVIVK